MAKNIWTVDPNVDQIDLEWDGHPFWIKLKRELTVGEKRYVQTAGFRSISGGEGRQSASGATGTVEIGVDWKLQSFARTYAYLTDWSLTDDESTKLKLSPDVIQSLHEGCYGIIEEAITKHVEAQEAKKKPQAGDSSPSPTSS